MVLKKKRNQAGRCYRSGFLPAGFGLLFLFISLSASGQGQVQADSNSLKHESLRQGINTFSFGNAADLRYRKTGAWSAGMQAGQYAIYNRALPASPFITHNLSTGLAFSRMLGKVLSWDQEAAQQSYLANKTRLARALTGLSIHISPARNLGLSLRAQAGLVNDKRQQFDNSGLNAAFHAAFYGQSPDSGSSYHAELRWNQSNPFPRKNRRLLAWAGAEREFRSGGLLALEGQYLKNQVEDYLGNDIQSIQSDTVLARFRIRIPLFSDWLFQSSNEFLTPNRSFFYLQREGRREIRNVRYFQDEYQSLSSLLFRREGMQMQASFESRLRNRTYDILNRLDPAGPLYFQQLIQYNQQLSTERIKDIREQYSTYSLDGRIRITSRHSLRALWTGQLLRVDTRSEQNNQDRDELLYAGEISHDWSFPFGFRLSNKVSASSRHLIFIKESQSSENYTDRILRWEPSLRWSSAGFSWIGSMGIWATYQVRDFASQQEKNRSNRVLIFSHQMDYKINGRQGLVAELLRRENRLSQLNWKDFRESPIDTVILNDIALRYRFVWKGFALQAGYRAFWQLRKSRASLPEPGLGARLIYLRSYFIQQGPQLRFLREGNGRLRLQGEIWMQWSSQFFSFKKSDLPYLGNPVFPEQLALRENRFLPFFNLQAMWRIF